MLYSSRFSQATGRRSSYALLVLVAVFAVTGARANAERYVCPPCDLPCDSRSFDKPGTCPACGMALITEEKAKAALAAAGPGRKVAILIFDGVEIIDYTGPYEIFGAAGFDVYTVARTKAPITTAMGMNVFPKYSFDDAPAPDVLVIPGGGVTATASNPDVLKWIGDQSARAQHTMSVCNGAFILASAGLLDGLSATTTNGNIPRLKAQYPKINVVDNQRFVDNGRIMTTAGLSAGVDGALHLVALIMGEGFAELVALAEEYDWAANSRFVRATLADRLIPDPRLTPDLGKFEVASTAGGTDHWELVLRGTSQRTAADLIGYLEQEYQAAGGWTKVGSGTQGTTKWTLKGKDGKQWDGTLAVNEMPAGSHQFVVKINISRN